MNERWRALALAGHRGDTALAEDGLTDADPFVRSLALGALTRLGALSDDALAEVFTDGAVEVRRRAAELAARRPQIDLTPLLLDADDTVVETAAWACGEQETVPDHVIDRLIDLATAADAALVREASIAALGAIGDPRGLPAILQGCNDQPAVRRRAVLALAPFEGDDVDAALEAALVDRDWQVRQNAEDIR